MKDRNNPCIHYVCANETCKKGFKNVTMDKCKNCSKYRPRKNSHRPESIRSKRTKDKDRHDSWKDTRNW